MEQPQTHVTMWYSDNKWWVQRTPDDDISGPWETEEAAKAALAGNFVKAHEIERRAKGITMEVP